MIREEIVKLLSRNFERGDIQSAADQLLDLLIVSDLVPTDDWIKENAPDDTLPQYAWWLMGASTVRNELISRINYDDSDDNGR